MSGATLPPDDHVERSLGLPSVVGAMDWDHG